MGCPPRSDNQIANGARTDDQRVPVVRSTAPSLASVNRQTVPHRNATVSKGKSANKRKLHKQANESARDQFAALGWFIQRFEFIVSVLREHCRHISAGGNHAAVTTEPSAVMARWNICSLPFHHQAITAKPLVEIWRALVIEESAALLSLSKLTIKGKSVSDRIATEIVTSFISVAEARNRLVHASWQIGHRLPTADLSTLIVEKYKVGKGFKKLENMPASFSDLMNLSEEADNVLNNLGRFIQYYTYHPEHLEYVFKEVGGKLVFVGPKKSNARRKPKITEG